MQHLIPKDKSRNVKVLRHIQNITKDPRKSLLLVQVLSRTELCMDAKYVRPLSPRKDQVDNWLMQLATTYAGELPEQTKKMQKHFAWLREQHQQGLQSTEFVYRQIQAFVGYYYEMLVHPKDAPEYLQQCNAVELEPVRQFKWHDVELVCCLPHNMGYYGWAEVV